MSKSCPMCCVVQPSMCPSIKSMAIPWCHWYFVQKKTPRPNSTSFLYCQRWNKSLKCREEKNEYEFYKSIWTSLQEITLKKTKTQNTNNPGFRFCWFTSLTLGYLLARSGSCVYMCVHILRPRALNTSCVCSGKAREHHTSSVQLEATCPVHVCPRLGCLKPRPRRLLRQTFPRRALAAVSPMSQG